MDSKHVQTDFNKIPTLSERARALLYNRPVHIGYKNIADETGLTYGWIQSFAKGEGKDYGANRVQKLYEFLTNKPLFPEVNSS